MLPIKPDAKPLIELIVQQSRLVPELDPVKLSVIMPEYSACHIELVLEQISMLPMSDIYQMMKNHKNTG
ncbi:hypothetical protein HC725_04190 [Vibrio sp. S17_S38]|uniref:hypothetical protein n=1 Tax=Vibrio sp. S17_S38 TaxID=2720229 RepID=UPI00168177DA|nr:hypothetical protein [Vibrio sp. S17_S38]MBD1572477.1 hypothetical protein [Vibrio sp. S17_S38]